jgi:hypothetical protein
VTLVDGQTLNVDFALATQAVQLETVVSTGYLTQSTRTVTGSVANVNMDNVQSQAVEGIDKSLAGQVAGVQVLQSNGTPGGGPQIQIRGVGTSAPAARPCSSSTVSARSADRSLNPLNEIAPGDIEPSPSPDASSAAIHAQEPQTGSSGHDGDRAQSSPASSDYVGLQTIPQRLRLKVMNAQDFAEFRRS